MLPDYTRHLHAMGEVARSFPWQERLAYGNYLAQTYYYVTHSTRLLALAAGCMQSADILFHRRFLEHAAEEKGHEMMALKDLEHLGFKLTDFPELSQTRMFWEAQYYKIQHKDPMALMGYILALEAIAVEQCPWILTQLLDVFPVKCCTFIKVHGEEDPEHVPKAMAQILALDPARQIWVAENFRQSATAFQMMLEAIKTEAREQKLPTAA